MSKPTSVYDVLDRLCEAIKDAIEEMGKHPDDCVQDIWNDMLDKWETGLHMDVYHNIDSHVIE